jgi:hypothetical protein
VKQLYSALIKCQSQIKTALKDSKNPHFKSSYADLTSVMLACKDALAANDLAVLQLSRIHESGAPVLVTRIIHSSGEHVEGEFPLVCKDPNDPQKLGSAVTYARRYALSAALGITADDDDGQAASAPTAKAAPKAAPTTSKAADYQLLLEGFFDKPVAKWTDTEKVLARKAFTDLQSGKEWSVVQTELSKATSFQ